jgi:23S rRNA pseudouridine1911/1915/1917 synthase
VKTVKYTVDENEKPGMRLDKYISDNMDLISRSQLKQRIVRVLVNGKIVKLSRKINPRDIIEVEYTLPHVPEVKAENIRLDIIYEDENVIVINKPQGMVVHPGSGINSGTLVNGLMYYIRDLQKAFNDEIRPGIVHRLDKDTSGIIITAKNTFSHEYLSVQFRKRKTRKIYLAVVKGLPRLRENTIDTLICRDPRNRKRFRVSSKSGKKAVTEYQVIRTFSDYSFVRLSPKTGRTHQLRVHTGSIGCPILGDSLYSRPDAGFPKITLMLHAFKLYIKLPGEETPRMFRAPVPERFCDFFKDFKRS